MKKIALILSLASIFSVYNICLVFAENFESSIAPTGQQFTSLPIKAEQQVIEKKREQARTLSQWVYKTLDKENVQVAIITRIGPRFTSLVDKSGMTHSGFVFRHPESGQWTTYSLYSDPETNKTTSRLWQQSVEDFYYGQSGKKTDALMLLPSLELQAKLLKRLTAQPFLGLLPEAQRYNLVAPLESTESFNCTKWVLLQLYAAKENSSDTKHLLQLINTEVKAPIVTPNFIVKRVLKRKPDVNWQELSPPNRIHAVTVDTLYHSPLFTKTLFYHDNQ